jgi:hypothetical protein
LKRCGVEMGTAPVRRNAANFPQTHEYSSCRCTVLVPRTNVRPHDSVCSSDIGTESKARNSRGKIPPMACGLPAKSIALSQRPLELNSHTICAAGHRPDLDRAHSCRPAPCSPAGSRSRYAIRLRWGLDMAHSCRLAPCNPAGSRSMFARHNRNRMVAAVDNNTEHLQSLCPGRLLRQSRHLPTQSLLSCASQSSQLVTIFTSFSAAESPAKRQAV